MQLGKKIQAPFLVREFLLQQKIIKRQQTKKVDRIFVVPFNNSLGFENHETLYTLMYADAIAKQYRLKGESVLILPAMLYDYVSMIQKVGLENAIAIKHEIYAMSKDFYKQCAKLGLHFADDWFDFIEPQSIEKIAILVKELQKKGYIYETYDVRFWSTSSQTVLTENDIYFVEEKKSTFLIKFFIESKKHTVSAYLSDIRDLFGASAIVVHPLDKRYKKLLGKNVIVPIINKTIPLVADEKVDMTKYNGAYVLVPLHNQLHLDIANRIHLTDMYQSYNEKGMFTDRGSQFAGKPIDIFSENIIRYLEDISNLDKMLLEDVKIPHSKGTNEQLLHIAKKQIFFSSPDNAPYSDIIIKREGQGSIFTDQDIDDFPRWSIGQHIQGIKQIPSVWYNNTLQTLTIQDCINAQILIQNPYIGLLLLSLYDGFMQEQFTVEDRAEAMSQKRGKKFIWQQYLDYLCDIFVVDPKNPAILACATVLDAVIGEVNDGSAYDQLLHNIDNAPYLISINDVYSIDWSSILVHAKIIQEKEQTADVKHVAMCYDSSFQYALYMYDVCTNIIAEHGASLHMFVSTHTKHFVHQSLLVHTALDFLKDINVIQVKPVDQDRIFINQLQAGFLPDSIRSLALDNKIYEPMRELQAYEFYVVKMRNALRYVLHTKEVFDIKLIQTYIDGLLSPKTSLDENDTWILTSFAQLCDEQLHNAGKYNIEEKKTELYFFATYSLSEIYLQLSKDSWSPTKKQIYIMVAIGILFLLSPYCPQVAHMLLFAIAGEKYQQLYPYITKIGTDIKKNYKYTILMDMITFRKNKYQVLSPRGKKVDLYVQGNRDFINFVQKQEALIDAICKNAHVVYLNELEELPDIENKETIVNIQVGIFVHTELANVQDGPSLGELESDLQTKQQMLQKIRSILTLIAAHEVAMREKYTYELQHLKSEIDDLEFTIRKQKFLHQ